MRGKRLIYAATLFLLILCIVLFLLLRHGAHKPTMTYKATVTAYNIQHPSLLNSGDIGFFTGSSFATYSTKNSKTSLIGSELSLPKVSDVRWSNTGILFRASGYTQADDLYSALTSKGLGTDSAYWWLYSFSTGSVHIVLPSSVLAPILPKDPALNTSDALWNSDGSNYAIVDTSGYVFLSSDLSKSVYKLSKHTELKQFMGKNLYVQDQGGLYVINLATRTKKTLFNGNIRTSYVSADTKTIAFTQGASSNINSASPTRLYVINSTDYRAKKLSDQFDGVLSGTGGDLYAGYQNRDGSMQLDYYPFKGTMMSYNLSSVLGKGDTVSYVLPMNQSRVFIGSSRNDLELISFKKTDVHTPVNNDYKIMTDLYLSGFEIHYSPGQDIYYVRINNNPYATYQNTALDYIRSLGIDPNQIVINWSANDGVNGLSPAVDRTPSPDFITH